MFRLALRWENIDWTFGRASITHTLVRTRARVEWARAEEPAVAPDGVAPPILLEALRGEETVQARQRALWGTAYCDHHLVFCQSNGKPLHAQNITQRDFRKIAERLGLPHIRFHDLRHSTATMLLRQGAHPKVVSEQLGHASTGVTLDTYSHVLPALMEEAAFRLADRLIGER